MGTAAIPMATPRRRQRPQHVSGRANMPEVPFSKKIDNSRLVREVDRDRRRECYTLLLTGVLILGVILGIARQQLAYVKGNYQIESLKKESATLEEVNKQLRLEKAALTDPQRIDALAQQQLGLAPESPQQVVRLGSAVPAARPAGPPELAGNFGAAPPSSSRAAQER